MTWIYNLTWETVIAMGKYVTFFLVAALCCDAISFLWKSGKKLFKKEIKFEPVPPISPHRGYEHDF